MGRITYEKIREDDEIGTYINLGNEILGVLGYSKKDIELAQIAGYMHDIGNCVNRNDHAHNGAVLSFKILRDMEMDCKDVANIVAAIGNHDEKTGYAVTAISAAIILADKSDVRRNRVRNTDMSSFGNHDRVNYAAMESKICVNKEKGLINLDIKLDENICTVLDYFESKAKNISKETKYEKELLLHITIRDTIVL